MSNSPDNLTLAICRACGVDSTRVTAVTYQHQVGSRPTLTVTYRVIETDTGLVSEQTFRFVAVEDGDAA